MVCLQTIQGLPENFDAYVSEISAGLSALYGPASAAAYEKRARRDVRQAIGHPSVTAVAALEGKQTVGLLFYVLRGSIGQISFIHVLKSRSGRGIERRLLEQAVPELRNAGAAAILSESVSFCPLDDCETYRNLGFTKIERAILGSGLGALTGIRNRPARSRPMAREAEWAVAKLLVESYREEPDFALHCEIRTEASARLFVASYVSGSYGETSRDYARIALNGGAVTGVVLGCKAAPDVGFVLQLAVSPAHRGQGVGRALIEELAMRFTEDGLDRIALGVTLSNPARILYEDLGLTILRKIDAHVWWRPGTLATEAALYDSA